MVDDATWAALCGHVGLTGADAAPGARTCIAINRLDIYGGAKYTTLRPLAQAALGTDAELILPTATDGSEWIDVYDVDDESNPVYGVCYTDAEGNLQTKQLGHETVRTERLRIAALAEDVGDDFPLSLKQLAANCPTLIVSASTAKAAGITDASSMTSICVGTGGKSVDEDKLVEAVGAAGLDTSYTVAIAEQLRNNNAMAYTAQVFLYCFTAICALIAVANVFNTISSGLALRTREFAVLRSVGLGQGGVPPHDRARVRRPRGPRPRLRARARASCRLRTLPGDGHLVRGLRHRAAVGPHRAVRRAHRRRARREHRLRAEEVARDEPRGLPARGVGSAGGGRWVGR